MRKCDANSESKSACSASCMFQPFEEELQSLQELILPHTSEPPLLTVMDEFELSESPSLGPMRDAVDFCRPLAATSKVKLNMDLRGAENTIVKANSLRLQQVRVK